MLRYTAGFGLGALNDADDDDMDVYDTGDTSSSRRRMAFQDDEDDDMITLGPSTQRSRKRHDDKKASTSVSLVNSPTFTFREAYSEHRAAPRLSTTVDQCHPALPCPQNPKLKILGT